jgi:hypothetical protein
MRHPLDGAVAQLGERVVRNDEVRSSILLSSTNGGFLTNAIVSSRLDHTRSAIAWNRRTQSRSTGSSTGSGCEEKRTIVTSATGST